MIPSRTVYFVFIFFIIYEAVRARFFCECACSVQVQNNTQTFDSVRGRERYTRNWRGLLYCYCSFRSMCLSFFSFRLFFVILSNAQIIKQTIFDILLLLAEVFSFLLPKPQRKVRAWQNSCAFCYILCVLHTLFVCWCFVALSHTIIATLSLLSMRVISREKRTKKNCLWWIVNVVVVCRCRRSTNMLYVPHDKVVMVVKSSFNLCWNVFQSSCLLLLLSSHFFTFLLFIYFSFVHFSCLSFWFSFWLRRC